MPSKRVPGLRRHKASGQAVVYLDGKTVYLGKHGTPEAQRRYETTIAAWLDNGRALPEKPVAGYSVTALTIARIKHAEGYYLALDGSPTSEVELQRLALRRLRKLYGPTEASAFGPLDLKRVRQSWIDDGLARKTINSHTARLRAAFRWAASEELVDASVAAALDTVSGLRKGRSGAREPEAVRPVSEDDYRAVLPHLTAPVRALVELAWLTGARIGELVSMTTGAIDRSEREWVFRPASHKNAFRGQSREVFLGQRAQDVLRPWLKADPCAPLFSPRESEAKRHAEAGRPYVEKRKRAPGEVYTVAAIRRAIKRACKDAEVEAWTTHRLRHSMGTRVRAAMGIETAQAALGHESMDATQVYAEVARVRAREAARLLG